MQLSAASAIAKQLQT